MLVGDPNKFAIESEITLAYQQPSWMALGSFVIHINGSCYGVREPDATMLAASYNEVGRRIARRGSHQASFPMKASTTDIASSFRRAFYTECEDSETFLGLSARQFKRTCDVNHIQWAPDGDEAFDDGSYVLHFEDQHQVRLIAFVSAPDFLYDSASLRDVYLPVEGFYWILKEWHRLFMEEWSSCPKVSEFIQ